MARKPAAAPPSGQTDRRERDTPGESDAPGEHVGPLALERLSKDDGRALILYSLASPPRA